MSNWLILGGNELSLRQILARSSCWQWLITGLLAGAVLLAIAIAGAVFDVNIGDLTRDPAKTLEAHPKAHPLTGLLSNFGVLLWCAAACVCLFTALVARKRRASEVFAFTLCSALLSSYLMFDDLFMFHDYLAKRYLKIPETWVYGALGGATLIYLIRFRVFILLKSNFVFLVLALGFLSLSVLIDTVFASYLARYGHWRSFFEDGFKWLGIACWCSYYVRTCYQFVVEPDRFAPAAAR